MTIPKREEIMDESVAREIISCLSQLRNPTLEDVNTIKMRVAKKYGLDRIPSNSEIIRYLNLHGEGGLVKVLRRKRVRTLSGVTVVAVMTRPWPCPKENPCIYCPGGPKMGSPQSYTGHEPAAMRGLQNNYDPYMQVRSRINQLISIGHKVDKIELIVMGGTFPAMPVNYQREFIKRCLDAINGVESSSLEEAKRISEHSRIRNVGITVETRPDWAGKEHVDLMLSMGVTRVELGVQTIYDDIYEIVDRGHNVQDVVEATRTLKDSGLKVVYHIMPGLPGSSFSRDLEVFKRIFNDERFRPDMIKIYPCLVIKGTRLYDLWRRGLYRPYSTEEAADLILEVKRMVPEWVRIMRIQRDIPAYLISAGVDKSNLRQIVQERLRRLGLRCRCIRCREVGHRMLRDNVEPDPDNVEVVTRRYRASEGEEFFISVEDLENDILIGYLRLRIPSGKEHRPEISEKRSSLVRELRICGPLVPIHQHSGEAYQHRGYGALLLMRAEEISVERGVEKILVTSALGTKQYYKRLGYRHDGPYMSKELT